MVRANRSTTSRRRPAGSAAATAALAPAVSTTATVAAVSHAPLVMMQTKFEPTEQPLTTKVVTNAVRTNNMDLTTATNSYTCACCSQLITERHFLYTEDRSSRGSYWHVQCLRCQCCDALLAEIASTFYTKDNAIFCKSDYVKRYGSRPCLVCNEMISPNEQIMRLSPNHIYHLSCFVCMECHRPLVKGDRYVLFNGRPHCEKHNPFKSTTTNKRTTGAGKRGGRAATTAAARNNAQIQVAQPNFLPPLAQYHPNDPSSTHFHGSPVNTLLHSSNVLDSSAIDEFY